MERDISPSVLLLDCLGLALKRHIFLPFSRSCESFLLPFLLLLLPYLSGKEGGRTELVWSGFLPPLWLLLPLLCSSAKKGEPETRSFLANSPDRVLFRDNS